MALKHGVIAFAMVAVANLAGAGSGLADEAVASVEHVAPSSGADSDDEVGTLNPQGLGIEYWIARSKEARFDPGMCLYGYALAKIGWHEDARRVFERCSEAGIAGAMPWMAWTEENGYDRPSDPVAAAEWDRKLADAGSSLGQFNYGLDILRGHGVTQDRALGKSYVDKAASGGDITARELAQHDYDPESVTPDADKAHYRKPQF
ncbi:MAG: tetratricopeptide repeat protein [Rhodoblastus sp.]|uniref:tetratricopeptide repeat protein n=1 Tax=Rhodoblastus sp. TaxID=1962975 RepID=UPI003F9B24FC